MMDRLTLEDLNAYAKTLNTSLEKIIKLPFNIIIKEPEIIDRCFCGCNSKPISEILVNIIKTNKIKTQGVTIYPTNNCYMPIINCFNRGAYIDLEIYQTIQSWIKSIPNSFERQSERTNTIEKELIERIFSPEKVDILYLASIL